MSTLLSSAQILDMVRTYGNLTSVTDIEIYRSDGSTIAMSGKFKSLGPNHIDFGTNDYTFRVVLDEQFTRVMRYISPDAVRFVLPNNPTM